MQALLEARAGLEATRSDGSTALITAAYMGHTEVVQALLGGWVRFSPNPHPNPNPNPNPKPGPLPLPLSLALTSALTLTPDQALLGAGASLDPRDADGTALDNAIKQRRASPNPNPNSSASPSPTTLTLTLALTLILDNAINP